MPKLNVKPDTIDYGTFASIIRQKLKDEAKDRRDMIYQGLKNIAKVPGYLDARAKEDYINNVYKHAADGSLDKYLNDDGTFKSVYEANKPAILNTDDRYSLKNIGLDDWQSVDVWNS